MAALSAEARALLETIAGPESSGNYDVMYGGGRFSDFGQHPNTPVMITSGPNKGKYSTAAGKYQFLHSTWDDIAQEANLSDFSPQSQDIGAWTLAKDEYKRDTGRDLQTDLAAGDLSRVPASLKNQWTSMPGGIEQGITGSAFANAYNRGMGMTLNANPALDAIGYATAGTPNSAAGLLNGGSVYDTPAKPAVTAPDRPVGNAPVPNPGGLLGGLFGGVNSAWNGAKSTVEGAMPSIAENVRQHVNPMDAVKADPLGALRMALGNGMSRIGDNSRNLINNVMNVGPAIDHGVQNLFDNTDKYRNITLSSTPFSGSAPVVAVNNHGSNNAFVTGAPAERDFGNLNTGLDNWNRSVYNANRSVLGGTMTQPSIDRALSEGRTLVRAR